MSCLALFLALTNAHTDGTDFIPSTADAGVKNMYIFLYALKCLTVFINSGRIVQIGPGDQRKTGLIGFISCV